MAVMPGWKTIFVLSAKDLNPCSSSFLMIILMVLGTLGACGRAASTAGLKQTVIVCESPRFAKRFWEYSAARSV
jgi:hypothetical protein